MSNSKKDDGWYTLDMKNSIDWFIDVADIAKREGKDHVLNQTCANYSSVQDPENREEQYIDPTRKEAFENDSMRFAEQLGNYINHVDKDLTRDVSGLNEKWNLLRKKYSINRLTNFKLDETKTIEENWAELHEFRRIAQEFEWTCSDDMMLRMFLDGLPKEYDDSKNVLNASNCTTDQNIKALQDECDRRKKEKTGLVIAEHVSNITLDPRYDPNRAGRSLPDSDRGRKVDRRYGQPRSGTHDNVRSRGSRQRPQSS